MDEFVSKPIKIHAVVAMLATRVVASPPALDAAVLNALREDLGGDAEALRDILGTFRDHARSLVAKLDDATRAGVPEGLRALAHDLKGSAATFGATDLAASAGALERAAIAGAWADVPALAAATRERWRLVEDSLASR
jgi:HPt (histidine-containing phosphotransfer) domain-containing protein